jgi:hypothetical protein
MRIHHAAAAVAALILVGLATKLFFFSAPPAEATPNTAKSSSMDISKMQENLNLPIQKMHDMTFVYSDGD